MNDETTTETAAPETMPDLYNETPETTETETHETPETTPAAERQPSQLTPEQITASVREGLRQSQPAQPERQWTKEELDKAFNVWQPTQEVVDQLLQGGENALKAFAALRDGLSKQFGTLLQYSIEVAKQELNEKMTPALTFAQAEAAARDRADFFEQNEDLAPYEKLTQTVFNALKAEGYQAATKEEAFKTLADRTRALIPQGNGAGATQSGGARTTTPTQKRPASLSSGSQAGGGGPSAPVAPFAGAEIWS